MKWETQKDALLQILNNKNYIFVHKRMAISANTAKLVVGAIERVNPGKWRASVPMV